MKKLPQQSRLKILTILGKSVDKYAPGNAYTTKKVKFPLLLIL